MDNSWYVEYLIRNNLNIRERINSPILTEFDEPAYTLDLDDDLYNDLLLVESTIKEMWNSGRLTKKQKLLIHHTSLGRNLSDIERSSGISRITLSKIFTALCGAIGYRLGGQFTDLGFSEYMQEKYSLNTEQIQRLQSFLESNKRHSSGGTHVD